LKDDNKRWKAFYEWRRGLRATGRLHDAPGHEVAAPCLAGLWALESAGDGTWLNGIEPEMPL